MTTRRVDLRPRSRPEQAIKAPQRRRYTSTEILSARRDEPDRVSDEAISLFDAFALVKAAAPPSEQNGGRAYLLSCPIELRFEQTQAAARIRLSNNK